MGTVSKATLGKHLRDGVDAYGLLRGHRCHFKLTLILLLSHLFSNVTCDVYIEEDRQRHREIEAIITNTPFIL